MVNAFYEKRLMESMGDTVTWAKLGVPDKTATEAAMEVNVLLPKDLLDELEKLDEKRINEHLTNSRTETPDYGRSISVEPSSFERAMSQQDTLNRLMNQRIANQQLQNQPTRSQPMFASAQMISRPGSIFWNR